MIQTELQQIIIILPKGVSFQVIHSDSPSSVNVEVPQTHSSEVPLVDHLRLVINEMSASCRPKTTVNRITAVNKLEQFLKEKPVSSPESSLSPLTASTLTADCLRVFELWHRDHNLSRNYTACNMRNLRTLLRRIVGRARCSELFEGVRTAGVPPLHKDINRQQVRQFFSMPLDSNSLEALVRDIAEFRFRANPVP